MWKVELFVLSYENKECKTVELKVLHNILLNRVLNY